jgi:hypothetical protein
MNKVFQRIRKRRVKVNEIKAREFNRATSFIPKKVNRSDKTEIKLRRKEEIIIISISRAK